MNRHPMNTAVEAEGLGRSFGSKRVLDDVPLTLRADEVTGFVGANGAGKSTTIQLMPDLLHGEGSTLSSALVLAASRAAQPEWGRVVEPALRFAAGRAMLTDVSAYPADDRPFARALVGSDLATAPATGLFCLYTVLIAAAG
ncbi:ATP-binding cassette domain-containing protein [Streptomyces sp. NPDC096339]|uniref:ATP-binding cassette domain-containing protein n=1 Tax=Streptomyces sp. NPDC096339 TaxID=3366086 RepID=UPI00381FD3CA